MIANKTPKMNGALLSDEEIVYFYRNVVMYYELGDKKRKFSVIGTNLKEHLQLHDMLFDIGEPKETPPKKPDFLSKRKIGFWFINSKKNQVTSLLSHLRNSISHCKVTCQYINNEWNFCFQDEYQGKVTMLGKLPKKLLPGFIEALKLTETKVTKNPRK